MPEISVVMPVYNGEEYLSEAIESILNQTFGDFEFLIVCEYGSNGASMKIVEEYAARDERIRLLRNSERLGISASLNAGIRAAAGRYIARMDGDDVSGLRRFAVQKLFLDTYPEIGVCGIFPTMIYAPGLKAGYYIDYVADPEQIASSLLFSTMLCHPSIMMRRELTEQCLYDESLMGMEDRDYFIRLSRITKLTNIMDPSLFFYRRTGENASKVYYERDNLLRRQIQQRTLRETLGLEFDDHELDVLSFTGKSAYEELKPEEYVNVVRELDGLLQRIEERNDELGLYRPEYMLQSLRQRWFRERRKLERVEKTIPKSAVKAWKAGKYYSPWF